VDLLPRPRIRLSPSRKAKGWRRLPSHPLCPPFLRGKRMLRSPCLSPTTERIPLPPRLRLPTPSLPPQRHRRSPKRPPPPRHLHRRSRRSHPRRQTPNRRPKASSIALAISFPEFSPNSGRRRFLRAGATIEVWVTPFPQSIKEFFFYGDSRHTDASGHDHQAQ